MNYPKTLVKKPSDRMSMRLPTTLMRRSRNPIRMTYWNNSARNMMTMRPWNPSISQNRVPVKTRGKKTGPCSYTPGPGSPEIVDDALFLSPKKHEAPGRPRVTRTRIIVAGIVLVVFIVAVYLIGLPMVTGNSVSNNDSNSSAAEITPLTTPVRTIPPTITTPPVPVSRALVPLPTQLDSFHGNYSLRGPKEPGHFKDPGHFYRRGRGGQPHQCGYQGDPYRTDLWQRGSSSP